MNTLKMLTFLGKNVPSKLSSRTLATQITDDHLFDHEPNDVIFQEFGDKGLITLNRPKSLNALSFSITMQLISTLKQWESTKNIVVIKGAGDKAFCAGGDIKGNILCLEKSGGEEICRKAIPYGYSLSDQIGAFKKPYVALISGIVMGRGAGISVHGKYRVATEKTLFAMPETAIGLFPNAGGTYFLPRLNGKLGWYLGLTGRRLKGLDVKLAGIATHYVSSTKLEELTKALLAPGNQNVEKILADFDEHDPTVEFSLTKYSKQIDKCFSGDTVEEIIKRLNEDGSGWALGVVETLLKMSPTSLKVTLRAFNIGKNMKSLTECLDMENYLEQTLAIEKTSDFYKGVRALLIDKNKQPMWNPKILEDVTDEYINNIFSKVQHATHSKL